ncbi:Serine/threonine kinase [Physocladia obscura]|uniref:Serine/threonine kinase n=1 Tax=Physocladia obscura TaxID=109957 RepID=A0AAD5SSW6_9FUNG|nr:Serine/threonine kinase [Physocladia obscura]
MDHTNSIVASTSIGTSPQYPRISKFSQPDRFDKNSRPSTPNFSRPQSPEQENHSFPIHNAYNERTQTPLTEKSLGFERSSIISRASKESNPMESSRSLAESAQLWNLRSYRSAKFVEENNAGMPKIDESTTSVTILQSQNPVFEPEHFQNFEARPKFRGMSVASLFSKPKVNNEDASSNRMSQVTLIRAKISSTVPPTSPNSSKPMIERRSSSKSISVQGFGSRTLKRGASNISDQDTSSPTSSEDYRHGSVTAQVQRIFRQLEDNSSILPEYLKRKLPRIRRAVVPRIHSVEVKVEEWPWFVDFCQHWDFLKAGPDVTAEIAKHRLNRILYKLRDEARFNESCQNILKSICLSRESGIIVSKDERSLRDDIEKSDKKVKLLIEAERRYKSLINWFIEDSDKDSPRANNTKINAILRIKLIKIMRLSITATSISPASPAKQKQDVFAIITVNDSPKVRTSRVMNLWDETFEIAVDRLSNRIEIQIYQFSLVGNHEIIGLLWFTVNELREELLAKYFAVFPVDVAEATLCLEPRGSIVVKINLAEPARLKQNILENELGNDLHDEDIYLTEDIRKVYTKNGHQFQIFKSASNIAMDMMGSRCSVCEESMIGGMRCYCKRCTFVCHTKCFKGVLTKCINNEDIKNAPIGTDLNTGQLLEYNKPHNFATRNLNLLRSWCTHCGLKVIVGERLVQCSECGKCAHDKCKGLVPNFCGLSLADAAAFAIKEDFKDKKRVLGF